MVPNMKRILVVFLVVGMFAAAGGAFSPSAAQPQIRVEAQIRIDQFGYLPNSPKVAVLADPIVGADAAIAYNPGQEMQVRRWSDDEPMFAGEPVLWNGGDVDPQSGDRGWWFDFTDFRTPGSYYLFDVDNQVRSHRFEISNDVYDDVLDAALKALWFNRGNVAHPRSLAGPWADSAAYVGRGQDTEARWVDAPDDASTARDLSGGWFDAGDTNKYVTFASSAVHQLLSSYQSHPEVFDDAVGITESGNGIADVLDEVRFEIQWLKKMQNRDGGVLLKVGEVEYGQQELPSQVTLRRYYEEACSSSTIAAAGMFAHAAVVFADVPELRSEVRDLKRRAVRAFRWFQRNPIETDCDQGAVNAGDADASADRQLGEQVTASVYLHELTGKKKYRRSINKNLQSTTPFTDPEFARYEPQHGDALAFYTANSKAGKRVVRQIRRAMKDAATSPVVRYPSEAGLYRSYLPDENMHWGSNLVRANAGSSGATIVATGVDKANRWKHLDRASTNLQTFHGLNPLGLVYLSNMDELGGEHSVSEIYHYWFADGTDYDSAIDSRIGPPPGYVPGGPNATYSGPVSPPANQPPLKAYADWNAYGNDDRSYEITEPGIYYQASYIRLLSGVMVNDR